MIQNTGHLIKYGYHNFRYWELIYLLFMRHYDNSYHPQVPGLFQKEL